MAKLVRWNVPFAGAFYPSVTATFQTSTQESLVKMEITISASDGTRFHVECTTVLAFTCFDESCAPKRWFSTVETEQADISSYQCLDSPWIESYAGCQYDVNGDAIPLNHYLIYGGDNIVEFLCQNDPKVSQLPNWN